MSNEAQNTQLVQSAYAAFSRGDIDAILAVMDEHIDWHPVIGADPTTVPYAGRRRGRASVREFFDLLARTTDFQRVEPREFIAQGDQVVVIGDYAGTVQATGAQLSAEFVMVFAVRNGRMTRFREWTDTAHLERAYGAAV